MKSHIIFILGPTSSGKTAVSTSLAEKINGEVISCDSMQVYRDMDIVTQAPSVDITSKVPHYLVREIPPDEEYNAAKFTERSKHLINDITNRKKVPVFAGGTGLYVKALVDGLFAVPPRDEEVRKDLEALAEEKGNEYVHKRLAGVDPVTAEMLHVNDVRRIIRALEIYQTTGKCISDKKKETVGIEDKYRCLMFGMELDRALLYNRIGANVNRMFDRGIVKEVESLLEGKLSPTAKKALGIKEIASFLEGDINIDQAREELKKNTRRYAKRQLTWFRGDDRIVWIDADRGVDEIVKDIMSRIEQKT